LQSCPNYNFQVAKNGNQGAVFSSSIMYLRILTTAQEETNVFAAQASAD